jgi:hypothetical protein
MKMMSMTICSAILAIFAVNAKAHEYRHAREGSQIYFGNTYSYFSPYPTASLIGSIRYRNQQQRFGLQHRLNNSRFSNQRSYQRGYRNGYRDAQRQHGLQSRQTRYRVNSCYAISYDPYGNRIRRSLPASACRH